MDLTIDIARPVEQVFALLADLSNYPRRLPPSSLYATTTKVSDTPIRLDTTYVDRSKQATLRGTITDYRPPHTLAFHQETQLSLGRLTVDIH